MRHPFFTFAFLPMLIAVLAFAAISFAAQATVQNLRCEYKVNPVGIDALSPASMQGDDGSSRKFSPVLFTKSGST